MCLYTYTYINATLHKATSDNIMSPHGVPLNVNGEKACNVVTYCSSSSSSSVCIVANSALHCVAAKCNCLQHQHPCQCFSNVRVNQAYTASAHNFSCQAIARPGCSTAHFSIAATAGRCAGT